MSLPITVNVSALGLSKYLQEISDVQRVMSINDLLKRSRGQVILRAIDMAQVVKALACFDPQYYVIP